MKNVQPQKKVGGIAANAIMFPIIAILAVIDIAIIGMFLRINAGANQLSAVMSKAGVYIGEANSLLAGTSLLAQTSANFILVPVKKNGQFNMYPLTTFANELKKPRRGSQVLERFRNYEISEKARSYLSYAAKDADRLTEVQLHALALVNAVHAFPDMEPLNQIPLPALNAADQALSGEEKLQKARSLVLDSYDDLDMFAVSRNVNACVEEIRADISAQAADSGKRVAILRTGLWVATILITVILFITFVLLYKQMINPLESFVRLIASNQSLDEGQGMKEVRQVASAYNNLEKRRDALRSVAETDTLTSLPNRYRFEKYLLDAGEIGYSLAIVMFDINYLKETNDTYGHSAGDRLIQTAAHCIAACFGANSFRIGGDEFAAVLKDCKPETIRQMIDRFEAMQQQEKISVSLGYAYAGEIGETTLKALIDEADKKMYAQKQEAHKKVHQFFLNTASNKVSTV
jgi:diguanylate cyclase (GGDEF)-like protein